MLLWPLKGCYVPVNHRVGAVCHWYRFFFSVSWKTVYKALDNCPRPWPPNYSLPRDSWSTWEGQSECEAGSLTSRRFCVGAAPAGLGHSGQGLGALWEEALAFLETLQPLWRPACCPRCAESLSPVLPLQQHAHSLAQGSPLEFPCLQSLLPPVQLAHCRHLHYPPVVLMPLAFLSLHLPFPFPEPGPPSPPPPGFSVHSVLIWYLLCVRHSAFLLFVELLIDTARPVPSASLFVAGREETYMSSPTWQKTTRHKERW